ncbi:MAG: chromosome segregation protein SMC [Phycisphaerales bacterium]
MRLSKLTLTGFKSFADPTEFSFDHPVTGIVGPNGCGKSNVVDAIKWVLGERSSKSLRGQEMIDVIFAGSAGRKPMGMAGVKLTFENPVIVGLSEASPAPGETAAPQPAPVVPASNPHADAANGGAAPSDLPTESALAVDTPATDPDEVAPVTAAPRSRKFGRMLPVDSDVVEIERRLYRDGGSEYLVNGRQARLKDIREMFLDTGVGADAYSIIEQGKVDAMLLASPQERRVIFEEAAGIAKYKQRRIEATRKLERTETNLKVSREELESTERRLRLVKGQAAKARRFQELDSEYRGWRLALAFDQYDDLQSRIDGLTSRQSGLGTARDEANAALSQAEAAKQEAELARHEAQQQHRELEQARMQAEHLRQQGDQRRTMFTRNLEEAQRQGEGDKASAAQVEQDRASLEVSVTDQREQIAALSEQLGDAERRLTTAATQRAEHLEALGEKQRAASAKQANAARIDRERAALLASIEGEARRAAGLREQIEALTAKAGALARDRDSASKNVADHEQAVKTAKDAAASLEARLKDLESQTASLGADRQSRAASVAQLDQELVRADSRRSTLQEMVESRVGYAEAVRKVMTARDKGDGFAGVVAPLAELVQTRKDVDSDAAQAVELAFAADLQSLVVESIDAVPDLDALARIGGRVTCLALGDGLGESSGHVPSLDFPADDPRARVVALRGLLQVRPEAPHAHKVWALLDKLASRTFLVADVSAALLLANGPLNGQHARFVTRKGDVIDEFGRITAGPANATSDAASGLLRRRAELESLTSRVVELSQTLETERAALAGVDAEASAIARQAHEARTSLAHQQRSLVAEQTRLERAQFDVTRLTREAASLEQETTQVQNRLAKIDADAAASRERAESLGRLQDEENTAAMALLSDLSQFQQRADAAGEQVTAAKVETSRLSEQLQGARRELARLESQRDELARRARDLASRLAGIEGRIAEYSVAINEAVAQAAGAAQTSERVTAELTGVTARLEDVTARAGELAEAVQSVRHRAGTLERDFHALEVSRRELEVKRENMEERTMSDLSLDLRAEHPEYRELVAVADDGAAVTRVEHAEAQKTIDELKREITRLGNVNLDALEEEKTLQGQNETLVRQVADIEQARLQLISLIEQLNTASKERFGGIFKAIQEQFGSETGMFRKLFGGGKAEVRLMPLIREVEQPDGSIQKVETDEYDVLESGIEVIAKPPGKEPRSISQLSGGEKTLTAVALLMSIFRSKPSCFCILDEVDAALDEGNVGRFNHIVREFTDQSAFIVITHNKRTMQNADRLYGVTMQERGVSTRVSVRFDQVEKDGSIHTAPHATAPKVDVLSSRPEIMEQEEQHAEVTVVKGKAGRKKHAKAGPLQNALAKLRETTEPQPTNN